MLLCNKRTSFFETGGVNKVFIFGLFMFEVFSSLVVSLARTSVFPLFCGRSFVADVTKEQLQFAAHCTPWKEDMRQLHGSVRRSQ